MSRMKDLFVEVSRRSTASGACNVADERRSYGPATQGSGDRSGRKSRQQRCKASSYCNIEGLTPEERTRHKQLSEKTCRGRKEIVEPRKARIHSVRQTFRLAELAEG